MIAASGWTKRKLQEIGIASTTNINPANHPTEIFELYSVPAHSKGTPEIVWGAQIGSSKQLVTPGDVLLCKIVPHLNRVWVVPAKSKHRQIASGEWIVVRNSEHSPAYIRHALMEPAFRKRFMETVSGVGGSLMRARPQLVSQIELTLAPPPDQLRIVTRIDTMLLRSSHARDELSRTSKLVGRFKQSVLTAAYKGQLTTHLDFPAAPGRGVIDDERRTQFFCKRRYEAAEPMPPAIPFDLPERWRWFRAEALCDFITKGTTPPAHSMSQDKGDVPYVKVYNLTFDGSLDFRRDPTFVPYQTHLELLGRSRVFPGDILMNIVGPPLGKVSMVPSSWSEWNINQAIAIFRPVESLNRKFLLYWLLSEQLLRLAVSQAKATAGQSNLTLQICRDLPIPMCSLEEQEAIVGRIEAAFSRVSLAGSETQRNLILLDRLEERLLANAFSGKLTLS